LFTVWYCLLFRIFAIYTSAIYAILNSWHGVSTDLGISSNPSCPSPKEPRGCLPARAQLRLLLFYKLSYSSTHSFLPPDVCSLFSVRLILRQPQFDCFRLVERVARAAVGEIPRCLSFFSRRLLTAKDLYFRAQLLERPAGPGCISQLRRNMPSPTCAAKKMLLVPARQARYLCHRHHFKLHAPPSRARQLQNEQIHMQMQMQHPGCLFSSRLNSQEQMQHVLGS